MLYILKFLWLYSKFFYPRSGILFKSTGLYRCRYGREPAGAFFFFIGSPALISYPKFDFCKIKSYISFRSTTEKFALRRTVMRKKTVFLFVLFTLLAGRAHAADDTIAVLITGWGMPVGYNFDYAWTTSDYPRIGDKTDYEGQPCKIGHMGIFPYASHINMIPWAITYKTEGMEVYFDYHGIYKKTGSTYVSPAVNLDPEAIGPDYLIEIAQDSPLLDGATITPMSQVKDQNGVISYPLDPRDNATDHLAGWYRIGSFDNPFPNGMHDLVESGPPLYLWLAGMFGAPDDDGPEASAPPAAVTAQDDYLKTLMQSAFGDRVDLRFGYYTAMPGYTDMEDDVAEEFAHEGFRKMVIARETTDHNRYANEFMSANYVKERLCEIGVLDEMDIVQSRQVGRTPEFNAMNIENLRPYIEQHAPGSTIAMIYVTRGLTWGKQETSGPFGTAHPWSREVYHENAYLNYLSWKKALEKEFGGTYTLVFTKNNITSDLREDNFYSYGLSTDVDLKGYSNEGGVQVYYGLRDAIDMAKAGGCTDIIVAPCHWNYDNLDTAIRMKQLAGLPLTPRQDMMQGDFEHTSCENAGGQEVGCDTDNATATITVAPSYGKLPEAFATAYFVMLRGALERFGLYPQDETVLFTASRLITKRDGGKLFVFNPFSPVFRSSVTIPPDPYPTRPEQFTPDNATAVSDPADTNDCLWEDTRMLIGWRLNPPAMQDGLRAAGPAVHMGPYRTLFNRDVTVRIPYRRLLALGRNVRPYIYNHVTEQWDALDAEKVAGGMVQFKTQVLGLFRAGVAQ